MCVDNNEMYGNRFAFRVKGKFTRLGAHLAEAAASFSLMPGLTCEGHPFRPVPAAQADARHL